MDFKKFYLSPEGRVNRKQFWLWLVLPLTAIEILLALVDVKTGNYNPELSVGLFSGIFALVALVPAIIVYIKRFHDRDKSGWWVLIGLIPIIDMLSSPQAKAVLAGIAAMLVKRFMQGLSRTA